MQIDKGNWFSHLNNLPSDITGYKTCTYLIALEGWRRGLALKFHLRKGVAIPPSVRFSLSNGDRSHFFTVSRGDKVTKEAVRVCMEKPVTYDKLAQNNVPIPEGKSFYSSDENQIIINYANKIGFPLVVKPTDAGSGRGVVTNITNLEEFEEALIYVREDLGFQDVIVERFIKGEDYRIYIVGDEVVGAYKRLSANIMGDGKSTIEKLITEKNKIRKQNPFIQNRPIVIDKALIDFLDSQNLTLNSIPKKGTRVFLRKQGTYLKERDPVDITDELSEDIKDISIRAMKSIPGLTHCDVDMLVNEETGEGFVNEINSRPQISNHIFPLEGKARDIPKKIIDFYFPETIGGKRNDMLYYDFKPVYMSFRSLNVKEITIPNIPLDHELTRFRLKGKLRGVNYERWIRRQAIKFKLNGYIKHLKNKETSVVISGNPKSIDKFRKVIFNDSPEKVIVTEVKEFNRKLPIMIGFEIKSNKAKNLSGTKREVKDLELEYAKLNKELNKYKKKYDKLIGSNSWKITKPFRKLSGRLRRYKS